LKRSADKMVEKCLQATIGLLVMVCPYWNSATSAQTPVSPAQESQRCLDALRASRPTPSRDEQFDRDFDRTLDDMSFACDIFVRPSEARSVIDDFKIGIGTRSREHISRSVAFPIDVGFYQTRELSDRGETIRVNDANEWNALIANRLTEEQRALIACASV